MLSNQPPTHAPPTLQPTPLDSAFNAREIKSPPPSFLSSSVEFPIQRRLPTLQQQEEEEEEEE